MDEVGSHGWSFQNSMCRRSSGGSHFIEWVMSPPNLMTVESAIFQLHGHVCPDSICVNTEAPFFLSPNFHCSQSFCDKRGSKHHNSPGSWDWGRGEGWGGGRGENLVIGIREAFNKTLHAPFGVFTLFFIQLF